jgi:hypothetical protein
MNAQKIAVRVRVTAINLGSFVGIAQSKTSNENKMSDGGRGRAPLGVEVWKSYRSGAHSGPVFAPSHG